MTIFFSKKLADENIVKTFFFKETELAVFPSVYGPTEDSFLLANCIKIEPKQSVLDIGTGSGIQAIAAAMQGAKVLATDINSIALKNAEFNAKKLKLGKRIFFKKSDLFEKIPAGGKFGLILFNPPYVPSGKIKWIECDGGTNGRKVLDKFLTQFPAFLKKSGKCIFLQSSLNGILKTKKVLKKQGFGFEIIARQKLFFEELIVVKAEKLRQNKKLAK